MTVLTWTRRGTEVLQQVSGDAGSSTWGVKSDGTIWHWDDKSTWNEVGGTLTYITSTGGVYGVNGPGIYQWVYGMPTGHWTPFGAPSATLNSIDAGAGYLWGLASTGVWTKKNWSPDPWKQQEDAPGYTVPALTSVAPGVKGVANQQVWGITAPSGTDSNLYLWNWSTGRWAHGGPQLTHIGSGHVSYGMDSNNQFYKSLSSAPGFNPVGTGLPSGVTEVTSLAAVDVHLQNQIWITTPQGVYSAPA